jgi:hypothetical protein
MAGKVNVSIADVSPNIYAAAKQSNLGETQLTQLDQFARTVKLNKNLLRQSAELARQDFNKLDPQVKEMLQFLYPDAQYAQPEDGVGEKLLGLAKGALKIAATPLLSVFKAAGAYGKAINVPYKIARQVAQGESLFSVNVLTDAWSGDKVFDEGALDLAIKDFGIARCANCHRSSYGHETWRDVDAQGKITQEFLDLFQGL